MDRLDTMETAVRAVWLLYARRKWSLLAGLGITRAHVALLEAATVDFERKLTDAQVRDFGRLPCVDDAATELLLMYRLQQLLKELDPCKPSISLSPTTRRPSFS